MAVKSPFFARSGLVSGFFQGLALTLLTLALVTLASTAMERLEHVTITLPFLGAVVFIAWFAGWRWALFAAVCSPILCTLFVIPPTYQFDVQNEADAIRLVTLVVVSLMVVALAAVQELTENERERAQLVAFESQDLFSRAFQSNPAAMSITRASDRRIIEVNESFESILGYTREEVLDGAIDVANIWADADERTAFTQRVAAEGGVQGMEVRLRTKSGDIRNSLGSATPVTISGEPALLAVFYDVTETRRSEAALSRAQAEYQSIFDNAVVGFYKTTADGHFLSANPALAKMLGYDSTEELIAGVTDIGTQIHVDPDRRDEFARHLREAGEVHGFEAQARRRDGSTVWIALTGRSTADESGRMTFEGIAEDITARKRREDGQQFLLEAGAELASTLEFESTVQCALELAVPALADFCVIDLVEEDGGISRIGVRHRDPAAEEALREMGRRYPHRSESHPIRQAIAGGRTVLVPQVDDDVLRSAAEDEDHYQLLRRVPTAASIFVPMGAHGRIIGAVTLSVATPARRFEPWDIAVAEGLAQRVAFALDNARLYARSQETQEELREANRAKDDFLSMVSHELRTPITTIRAGSRLLTNRSKMEEETVQEILADMDQESERLQLIVENLLALGRAELGRPVEPEPISVRALVNRVVSTARRLRPNREIIADIHDDLPIVSGVPLFAELVLRNLLDNALKYSPSGAPIAILAEQEEEEVSICVQDQGPGIAEDELELVFDRFYRASKTAKKAAGAGMGLSVCKRLSQLQGGRIWAKNRPEGGLQMTFTLPVYLGPKEEEPSPNQMVTGHSPP